MENPCKNCLVKPICITCCNELNNFIDIEVVKPRPVVPLIKLIKFWIISYEVRPRVIEIYPQYKGTKIKVKKWK